MPRENALACDISLGGAGGRGKEWRGKRRGEGSRVCFQYPSFSKGCPRDWYLPHLTWNIKESESSGCYGLLRTKKSEGQTAVAAWLSMNRRHTTWGFSLTGREMSGTWLQYSSFSKSCLTRWYLSCLRILTGNQNMWLPGGHWEQGKVGKLWLKK